MTTRREPTPFGWRIVALALALGAVLARPSAAQYAAFDPNFLGYNLPNVYGPDSYSAYGLTPPTGAFRGYNVPNVYAPGYYSAFGLTPPTGVHGPFTPLYGGSSSGNLGYYNVDPYGYRGYHGASGFDYPAFSSGSAFGSTGPTPLLSLWESTLASPDAPAAAVGTRRPAPAVTRRSATPEIVRVPGVAPAKGSSSPPLPRVFLGPRR